MLAARAGVSCRQPVPAYRAARAGVSCSPCRRIVPAYRYLASSPRRRKDMLASCHAFVSAAVCTPLYLCDIRPCVPGGFAGVSPCFPPRRISLIGVSLSVLSSAYPLPLSPSSAYLAISFLICPAGVSYISPFPLFLSSAAPVRQMSRGGGDSDRGRGGDATAAAGERLG